MSQPKVVLYRMKLPTHECPFGLRAKRLLEEAGIPFEDRLLTSREEVDAFEEEQGVQTTPIIFFGDERIDGSDELAAFLESARA